MRIDRILNLLGDRVIISNSVLVSSDNFVLVLSDNNVLVSTN